MRRFVDENRSRPTQEEGRPVRQIDELYGYGRSWREIADEMERRGQEPTERPESEHEEAMLRDLCHADSAEEVVRAVLDAAAVRFDSCILFRVKDNVAEPWATRSSTVDSPPPGVAFPVFSGSPLELLAVHPRYRGAVPPENAYHPFFARLGLCVPREMLLLPIRLGERLVGILYADGGPRERIRCPIAEELRLQQKLTLGLTLVLIKHKIRQ